MSSKARVPVAILAALLALGVMSGASAQPEIGGQSIIVNPRPGDLRVFVSVDRDPTGRGNPVYRIGDSIAVTVSVTRDAYIYVFSIHADGKITLILPNPLSENPLRLRGGQSRTLPHPGDPFSLTVHGPAGLNRVLALASHNPLSRDDLDDIDGDDVGGAKVMGADGLARALAIIVEPIPGDRWATATAAFTVAGLAPGLPRPPALGGVLSVDSDPRGAQVLVNGVLRGATPVRIDLPVGTYEVRLRLPGFEEFVSTVAIRPGQTSSVVATLSAITRQGTLSLTSSPHGALVWIDGSPAGVTPLSVGLAPGRYEVRVSLHGYEDFVAAVNVRAGQVARIDAQLRLVRRTGTLQVVASVPSAEIWLGGARVGVSPLSLDLAEGTYLVQVRAVGFAEFRTQVTIQAGRTARVDADLRQLTGMLRIVGAPDGAFVFVDGFAMGRVAGGSLNVNEIAAGLREVTVIAPGFRTSISQVNVIADRRTDLRVSLRPF